MRDKEGKTFKEISEYLDKVGYKTVRSNKTIKPQYVYSIYKKGKSGESYNIGTGKNINNLNGESAEECCTNYHYVIGDPSLTCTEVCETADYYDYRSVSNNCLEENYLSVTSANKLLSILNEIPYAPLFSKMQEKTFELDI